MSGAQNCAAGSQDLEDELERMIIDGRMVDAQRRGSLVRLDSNVVERNTDVLNAHARDRWVRFEELGHN